MKSWLGTWALFAVCVGAPGYAEPIECTKNNDPATTGPFAEGYCAVVHQTNPESWVRTSASLDPATGVVTVKMKLSTDSVASGPCGRMEATLRGANGKDLALITSQKRCIGGKGIDTGWMARDLVVYSQYTVPLAVAKATKSLVVTSHFDGQHAAFWGIDLPLVGKILN